MATRTTNDNNARFIGTHLTWANPTAFVWPKHVLDTGNKAASIVQEAGAAGISYANYRALKGSVSRLCYMQQKGAVKVAAPTPQEVAAPVQEVAAPTAAPTAPPQEVAAPTAAPTATSKRK